jgi:hypothetical protein
MLSVMTGCGPLVLCGHHATEHATAFLTGAYPVTAEYGDVTHLVTGTGLSILARKGAAALYESMSRTEAEQ